MTPGSASDPVSGRVLPPPVLPIRTERLLLRPYSADDADGIARFHGDPEVTRFLLSGPLNHDEALELVTRRSTRVAPSRPDEILALVVEHEGVVVGDVMLMLKGDELAKAEVGWVLDPAYGGRGLATEAARAMIDLAFGHYGMHRATAQLDARNTASARLCERLGMTREAHLRQDWFSKGEWTDTLVYGVLREEWARPR